MKWLHFSDLHFNPDEDGTSTIYLRDRMIDFLKDKQVKVDKVLVTGDFRDARKQADSDENAKKAANYIITVAQVVGVTDVTNILLVPGNHDLDRDYPERQTFIEKNKMNYSTEIGTINNLDGLINSFKFFKRVLKYVYNENEADNIFENLFKINPHRFYSDKNYNILLINTEILAGELVGKRVNDVGSLIVGSKYVINSFLNSQGNKNPTIVMAHRGLDQLEPTERRLLLNIFKNYNVCLYVCGHSHELWYDKINEIPQVTIGCIKQDNGVKAGFSIGELDENKNLITVDAFSWDNDVWKEYPHFYKDDKRLTIDISNKIYINNDDFNRKIRIVIDGRVRDFVCKVNDIEFDVEQTSFMSVSTGKLVCTIKNNKFSSSVTYNHKFILSNAVWCVIGINNTTDGITILTCRKELKGPYDDFEDETACKNLISKFEIELLAPIENIALNQKIALEAVLFKDAEQLENANLIWESSDENVVSIDNKMLIGAAIGEAVVKIIWAEDKDIFLEFNLCVIENASDNIMYRIYKKDIEQNKKYYRDFDTYANDITIYGVDKFINGNIVNNDQTYDFTFEPNDYKNLFEINEVEDTHIKILPRKYSSSKYTLNVTNKKTGNVESINFRCKGVF